MHFFLYKLTFKSGKSYIGQTTRKMITRITAHRQAARTGSLLAVHCAWRLHGEPVVNVIGEFASQEDLHAAEIAAIASHGTISPNGYNLCMGGETAPSKDPVVAAKISAAAKGRKYEDTSSWSAASKAHWKDEGYRERVISAVKASWTPEMRAARSAQFKAFWAKRKADGWVMPQSTRDKLTGRPVTIETKDRMSFSAKNRRSTQPSI